MTSMVTFVAVLLPTGESGKWIDTLSTYMKTKQDVDILTFLIKITHSEGAFVNDITVLLKHVSRNCTL